MCSLAESEQRWQFALESNRDGVWDWNIVTDEIFFSKQLSEILGYSGESSLHTVDDLKKLVHTDDYENVKSVLTKHFDKTHSSFYQNEYRVLCRDGSYKWILDRGKVVEWCDGHKPVRMIGTYTNISERKKYEQQLQLSSQIFNNSHEGIVVMDANGIIRDVNPAFYKITGYSADEVKGKNLALLNCGKQGAEFFADMWRTLKQHGHWQGELWKCKKNGEQFAELLSISSITDAEGGVLHYVATFLDITENKRQQETLELMAHYDVLTKLPNRLLLADRFEQTIAHNKRNKTLVAVCFLDLDGFKPVNDQFGHQVGDQLLVNVADRIKANIREEDTVSRQGGDEFIVLLGGLELTEECKQMVKRLNEAISKPYVIDSKSISISASIGISLYPDDAENLDCLMRYADQAMYQTKLSGRNGYHFYHGERDKLIMVNNYVIKRIEQALSNNELILYYQPKVNMATGEIYGCEALLRWQHTVKGIISAAEFLPLIERSELELCLNQWVIEQAVKQLEIWRQQGIRLQISVNISAFYLQSTGFISTLTESLARFKQLDSKALQLEIVGSQDQGDIEFITNIINRCRYELGVHIVLADFGVDNSSLDHLRILETHAIKIDRSFVRDVLDDPKDYAIVDGTIALANSFNRTVIAEGIESTEQGQMLLLMGCVQGQGNHIAKPMPVKDIPVWINNYIHDHQWMNYPGYSLNNEEKTLKVFVLIVQHWLKTLQSQLIDKQQADTQLIEQKGKSCAYWIKKVKQKNLFEDQWLNSFEMLYLRIFELLERLSALYQEQQQQLVNDVRDEIMLIFNKMNLALAEYR